MSAQHPAFIGFVSLKSLRRILMLFAMFALAMPAQAVNENEDPTANAESYGILTRSIMDPHAKFLLMSDGKEDNRCLRRILG